MDRALYIFDLDGVIYRGETPQPFAAETIASLRSTNKKVFFLTNNASKTRDEFVYKLGRMGIPASVDEIMTSSYATALWLQDHGHIGKTVMIVGEDGCFEELRAAGMNVIEPASADRADFVVVGIDTHFTYQKLDSAQQAIMNGATFLATNRDATYPLENRISPGGGSIVAAVATAAGREPITIGKPELYSIEKILTLAGTPAGGAVLVGDRLDTDIQVGNRAGVHTVLVLGGVTAREQAEKAAGEFRPERIITDLSQLMAEPARL